MFEKKKIEEVKPEVSSNKSRNRKEKSVENSESKALSILKTVAIPAVLAAIVVCVLYVAIERNATQEELKTTVVCMKENVSANTYVEVEDIETYFTTISVELAAVPTTAIQSMSELSEDGFYIVDAMSKSQMVLMENVSETNAVMDKYLNGCEVTSFAVSSFDSGVNGSLRQGDIVDVYALDPLTESLVLMVEDVYVKEVYDNSGNRITEASEVATSFTVYVTESEVEQMNLAVVYGGIQMYQKTE